MSSKWKRMIGARIPGEDADELKMLASLANRTVSEVVGMAIDDLLQDPVRVLGNSPVDARQHSAGYAVSAEAAEYYIRREALILACRLTSVFMAACTSWVSSEAQKGQHLDSSSDQESNRIDFEIGYDVVGALMRNAKWILDSWFSGSDYERTLVTEYLEGLTAQDKELAQEYQLLLDKMDRTKDSIQDILQHFGEAENRESTEDDVHRPEENSYERGEDKR
jgi:hypothetical protein